MNCNCNNNNTMKEAKIKHVFGNVLRVAIPLTLRTVELVEVEIDGETKQQAEATDTDFIPSSDYPVLVVFSKGAVKVSLKAQMRDGNVAYVEDKGSIPIGIYDITVTCNDNNGNPYRFKQNTTLQVVDTTAEAGIVTPIEYEVITWYLDAAIYLALKGEDGVGIEDIETQSSGEIGGVNTVTFILTDGRTRSFNILNGSGATDSELDINSHSPIANSAVTAKFNELSGELADLFGDVDYDTSSKSIRFWDKGKTNVLASLDARPFIKDGMVSNAYISNNTLVITFNTDSGKEAIGVPLTSVFNPNNYYTKTQVDSRIASAVANINLSNYYTKSQVDTLYSSLSSRVTPVEVIFTYSYNSITSNRTVNGIYTDYTNKKPIIGRYGNSVGTLLYISSQEAAFIFGDRYDNPFILRNSDSTHWGKDDLVDFSSFIDYEPTPESENAVSSGGVWDYLAQRIQSVTINGTTKTPDENGDVSFTVQGGGGYEPPVGGIPKSDLAQSVQDTLDDVSNKVDKVAGKGLSTEDYTTAEKQKLAGLSNYDDTEIQAEVDAKYEKPSTGIPKTDLASDVQTSLGKADTALQSHQSLADVFAIVDYDSTTKHINFYGKGDTNKATVLGYVDATNFIKDGMVSNVAISNGNLVVTFNTDSGKEPISIALTQIFNPENYYNKTAVDGLIANKVDKVNGKGLSTNDYTTEEKTKLAGIATGAEVNVQPNWTQTNTSADDYIKNKPTLATVATSGSYNDLQDKPTIPATYDDTTLSGRVTALENAGFITTETDPTIPSWAKQQTKPTYTAQEVGALPASTTIPTKTSDLTNDSGFINKSMYYGESTTAAATMPKVCTVETFPTTTSGNVTHAKEGTIIAVKFTNSDTNTTDAPKLNVNGIGAKAIMYNNAIVTSTAKNTTVAGTAKMLAYYRYDPALDEGNGAWEFLAKSVDSNSTYSNASLGQGYGTQSNSAAATAITASISSYALSAGGIVTIKFTYDVPANATLNINSKGAKAIYNKGAAITAGVIKAGDTATFIYSTYFHLLSVDSWQDKQDTISDLATIRSGASAGATAYQKPTGGIPASDIASGVIPDTSGFVTTSAMNTALAGKQNTLTFDSTPTTSSTNPVTSGGVKTYVDGKVSITGITTSQDGTFTITLSDGNSYTVNLNHVHPQYLKYELLADEAAYTALATKDSSTLYLIPES